MSARDPAAALEGGTQAFLDQLAAVGGPALHELPVAEARIAFRRLQDSVELPLAPVDVERLTIADGPSGGLPIRVLRPVGATGSLPAVLYAHGAGWVLGGFDTHERLVRELAVEAGAAIVFPEYTLAPEACYPAQNGQAFAALCWVVEHARDLGIDPERVAVAGDGAGGAIAAALTLMAKRAGSPRVSAQLLLHPVTDAGFDTPSYADFGANGLSPRETMRWFWDACHPDRKRRREPTASPLQAPLGELAELPPALVITGELDVLRDQGEAYARRLAQAGVRVTAVRYGGAIHDFALLNAIAGTPAARSAIPQAGRFLGDALA
jgi:acetyl esterase